MKQKNSQRLVKSVLIGLVATLVAFLGYQVSRELTVEITATHDAAGGVFELFYAEAGQPFAPSQSYQWRVRDTQPTTYRWRYQGWRLPSSLRIDPASGATLFTVHSVRVGGQDVTPEIFNPKHFNLAVAGDDPQFRFSIAQALPAAFSGLLLLLLVGVFIGASGLAYLCLQRTARLPTVIVIIAGAVIAISLVLRFTMLDFAPGPAHMDEAATAANVLCLAQEGRSAAGDRWPLYGEVLVDNWEPPTLLYPAALMAAFGADTLADMRMVPGAVAVLTIIGAALLALVLSGWRAAGFTLLLATLMPWSFQAGRLLWKSPLAPMFVVWGVLLLVLGLQRRSHALMILSGITVSLGLYSYQSAWAQAPVLFVVIGVVMSRANFRAYWHLLAVCAGTIAVVCIPLFLLIISGDFMRRAAEVAVTASGNSSAIGQFFYQLVYHFHPNFLFVEGDANLRHGMPGVGQLSWADGLAWSLAAVALVLARPVQRPERTLLAMALLGIITGTLAAALSAEGIPHALRANGMWPFFALLGGWCMTQIPLRWRAWTDAAVVGTGAVFLVVAMQGYFSSHHADLRRFFPTQAMQLAQLAAERDNPAMLVNAMKPLEAQYYLITEVGLPCTASREFILEQLAQ